jgi:drug/metabolite transporter (DMT)-like permease
MSAAALGLILAAAVAHAAWNYAAKRARGGLPFVWLFCAVIAVLWAPPALLALAWSDYAVGLHTWVFAVVGGVLHVGYSLTLQRGYRQGDLSVVYPLARGTGPLVSVLAAVVLLGERPGALAWAGGLAIVGAIFWLARPAGGARPMEGEGGGLPGRGPRRLGRGIGYGLLCGLFIAAYTIWDRQAVAVWLIPPLFYDWTTNVARALLLAPAAWRRRTEVAAEARVHWREALAVAVLSPLAYFLVLVALQTTPVSYVAPAREVSIVIGAFLGAQVLKEGDRRRRLTAAGIITLGLAALALD